MKPRTLILSSLVSAAVLMACIGGCQGCAPIPADIGDAWIITHE